MPIRQKIAAVDVDEADSQCHSGVPEQDADSSSVDSVGEAVDGGDGLEIGVPFPHFGNHGSCTTRATRARHVGDRDIGVGIAET